MTNQEINERIAAITGFHNTVGLMKRGFWYRPNGCGYTACECKAGRYTMEAAKKHEYKLGDEPVEIKRFKTPNYAESLDACREFMSQIKDEERDMFADEAIHLHRIAPLYEYDFWFAIMTLTPLELCECFLKLKGQWE